MIALNLSNILFLSILYIFIVNAVKGDTTCKNWRKNDQVVSRFTKIVLILLGDRQKDAGTVNIGDDEELFPEWTVLLDDTS